MMAMVPDIILATNKLMEAFKSPHVQDEVEMFLCQVCQPVSVKKHLKAIPAFRALKYLLLFCFFSVFETYFGVCRWPQVSWNLSEWGHLRQQEHEEEEVEWWDIPPSQPWGRPTCKCCGSWGGSGAARAGGRTAFVLEINASLILCNIHLIPPEHSFSYL